MLLLLLVFQQAHAAREALFKPDRPQGLFYNYISPDNGNWGKSRSMVALFCYMTSVTHVVSLPVCFFWGGGGLDVAVPHKPLIKFFNDIL